MSDPSNQRADGCSVFFTFLVLALLLSGFFLAQRIFEPDTPAPVTESVDLIRHQKLRPIVIKIVCTSPELMIFMLILIQVWKVPC